MILSIEWENPIIKADDVLQICSNDLDDFYSMASAPDKTNIFFVLLASSQHYIDKGNHEYGAHLCFLMAYYLFIALTPPASSELAKYYINKAISLNSHDEYKELSKLVEKGN